MFIQRRQGETVCSDDRFLLDPTSTILFFNVTMSVATEFKDLTYNFLRFYAYLIH